MVTDAPRPRRRRAPRLLVGAALASVTLLALTSTAFAAVHAGPRLVRTAVSFDIPTTAQPVTVWTLNLRQHGALLASVSATSGTLTVKVPAATHGSVQADVRRATHWYAGNRFVVSESGTGGDGTGGKGGGGKGGNGGGGSTTTKPSITAVAGAPVPITKAAGATAPVGLASTADPNPPTPGTALAFTGTSPALWTLSLGGLILVLVGAYLVRRRPAPSRTASLESLLRLEL